MRPFLPPTDFPSSLLPPGGLSPLPSLDLLAQRLPQHGAPLTADPHEGGLLYGALKNIKRVVQRLGAEEASRALSPCLVPGLCVAYCSPIADVRKATVDCLVTLSLVSLVVQPGVGRLCGQGRWAWQC